MEMRLWCQSWTLIHYFAWSAINALSANISRYEVMMKKCKTKNIGIGGPPCYPHWEVDPEIRRGNELLTFSWIQRTFGRLLIQSCFLASLVPHSWQVYSQRSGFLYSSSRQRLRLRGLVFKFFFFVITSNPRLKSRKDSTELLTSPQFLHVIVLCSFP